MNNKTEEIFRNAPVPKAVISNAIPAIISMIMVLLYNLADTFFIGQTKNPLMVAAVSVATPAFLIFMAVGMMFGIGGTSLISRWLGEKKEDGVKKVSSFCCWTGVVIGVISMVGIWCFTEPISKLVGASADTMAYTNQYLKIVATSIPFLIFGNVFSNVIRAEGHAKTAMTGMIVGNMVNIVLDPIMILGLKWYVGGAAAATVIGNLCSAGFYLWHLLGGKSILSVKLSDYSASRKIVTGVLAIGIPASLNSIMMSISNIFLNNTMAHYGDMAVAGLGVAMKVNMIVVMLLIGLGVGVQPLLGYCYGARNKERFVAIFKFSLFLAFVVSAVMTAICYFGAEPLVRAFLDNEQAHGFAFSFSRIYILSGPIIGILFVLINAIQSTGAAFPSFILSISRQGLVYIPVLEILYHVFDDARHVAMAQPIADYMSVIIATVLFVLTYKKYIAKF